MEYGFLSILPPLIAIIMAWRTKNVVLSLFSGAYIGTLIIFKNPITALVDLLRNYIYAQAMDGGNSNLLVLMFFIGGFVGLVTYSGGAKAFAESATRLIRSRVSAQVATWLGGVFIFFSDSASPLLVGSIFQPICDRMRVSREKLAWLLDTTASPVCILIPFIGWGVYIQGLIAKEYQALGINESEFIAFFKVMPFQFYALGAILMPVLIAFLGFEFSEMHKAEMRTFETGRLFWPNSTPLRPSIEDVLVEKEGVGVKPRATFISIPLLVLIVTFIGILIPLGFPTKPIPGIMLRTALASGFFLATLTCIVQLLYFKAKTGKECFDLYMQGIKEIAIILMILVLSWSLGSVCKSLGTAKYIVNMVQGTLPAWLVPGLIFVVGAIMSFATGSSWGTFAILMPLAIPVGHALNAHLLGCIAAVLSGGLFGDHCSPISDTTILASMGAGSDHIDHVKTQLPYAMTVALAAFVGYLVLGFIDSPVSLVVSLVALFLFVVTFGKIWGKKIPNYYAVDVEMQKNIEGGAAR